MSLDPGKRLLKRSLRSRPHGGNNGLLHSLQLRHALLISPLSPGDGSCTLARVSYVTAVRVQVVQGQGGAGQHVQGQGYATWYNPILGMPRMGLYSVLYSPVGPCWEYRD